MARPPIPAHLWKHLQEFLEQGKSGDLVFKAKRGTIVKLTVVEHVTAPTDDARRDTIVATSRSGT